MSGYNEFKLSGVFLSAERKELPGGTQLVEAKISQTRTYKNEETVKVFPVSAFGEVAHDLLGFKTGETVVLQGSIRSSAWAKDPSRHFINLTINNVESAIGEKRKRDDLPAGGTADEIADEIPF